MSNDLEQPDPDDLDAVRAYSRKRQQRNRIELTQLRHAQGDDEDLTATMDDRLAQYAADVEEARSEDPPTRRSRAHHDEDGRRSSRRRVHAQSQSDEDEDEDEDEAPALLISPVRRAQPKPTTTQLKRRTEKPSKPVQDKKVITPRSTATKGKTRIKRAAPKPYYAKATGTVLARHDIPPGPKLLWIWLCNRQSFQGGRETSATQDFIARQLGTNAKQIGRWSQALVEAGIISCRRRGARNANVYRVISRDGFYKG